MSVLHKLFVAAILLVSLGASEASAQAGNWDAYKDPTKTAPAAPRGTSAPPSTTTWNQETLNLDTRTVAEFLQQGYDVISVQLNYLSGNTELYMYNASASPKLLHCQMRALEQGQKSASVASRCMGF